MHYSVIWEKHKKFITQVTGGFAVFMILFSVAADFQKDAVKARIEIIGKNDDLQQRANQLDTRYDREVKLKKLLGDRRQQLVQSVSIVENARIQPPEDHSDTKFKKEKESVYEDFSSRANVAGIERPQLGDIRFNVSSELTDQDWDDRYVQLDIVDRFFRLAVDERIRAIIEVRPESIEAESINDNQDVALYRYPVLVTVVADHAAILRVMSAFQRANSCIGVEVESMEPAEFKGKTGFVEAQLRLIGWHLEKPREEPMRRGSGFGRPGKRR